jgi:hypothetical protein
MRLRPEAWVALVAALAFVVFSLSAIAVAATLQPALVITQVILIQTATPIEGVSTGAPTLASSNPDPSTAPTQIPLVTLAWASPLPASPTPLPSPTTSPSPQPAATLDLSVGQFILGQSAQGRDIVGYAFPAQTDSLHALVLVSGIHGDEMNAWPILQSLISNLQSQTLSQPPNLSLYFIESLNPDGAFLNRRLNANNVDLNRNWETYDWRTGVEISPVDFLPAGGGARPFSEPETIAMRNWLLGLHAQYPGNVTVVYFHAAVPPDGLVTPGTHWVNGRDLGDAASRELGQLFATATGYDYDNLWTGGYRVTGDASTWAVAQGMRSLTIELPTREELNEIEAQKLREGILAVVDMLTK